MVYSNFLRPVEETVIMSIASVDLLFGAGLGRPLCSTYSDPRLAPILGPLGKQCTSSGP